MAFSHRILGLALAIALLGTAARAQEDDDSATGNTTTAANADTTHPLSATTGVGSRRQKIELAHSQVETAQQTLDEAKKKGSMSEAEIDAVQQRIDRAREALDSVDTKLQTVRKNLQDMEKKLLLSQPPDSDVAKAQAAYDKAREDLDREAARVTQSPECQKRIKRVENVVDAGKLRAFIRRDALENDVRYQNALLDYQYARKEFNRLKTAAFSADTEWSLAAAAVREAEEKARKLRHLWAGLGF